MKRTLFGFAIVVLAVALAGAAIPGVANGADPAKNVKNRGGEVPRPAVAIDNVTAWPNLTLLRNGTIVATIFNQPCHGTWEGSVECWGSTDQGQTWKLLGTPAPHDPATNRMNVAAGLATDGDLLVIVSGWSHRPPKGQRADHKPPAQILNPWICRSKDGGTTWSIDRDSFPKTPTGKPSVPFGDILPGNDGKLRVGVYGADAGDTFVLRSDDDGKSWGEPSRVDADVIIHEPAIFHLGQGKWLLGARLDGLTIYSSSDDGRTWTKGAALSGKQAHPGHFARLKDGRILATYGNRVLPKGVDVRFSSDEGETWSDPLRVAGFEGDGGYPSSVQLPDGQILTAFYAQKTTDHPQYHMGTVIWAP